MIIALSFIVISVLISVVLAWRRVFSAGDNGARKLLLNGDIPGYMAADEIKICNYNPPSPLKD